MNKHDLFSIWAPPESIWSRWAKGVVFAHYDENPSVWNASPPMDVSWIPAERSMAIVVDLPGASSVEYGVALARIGFRPVPLFNAAPSQTMFSFSPAGDSDDLVVQPTMRREVVDVKSILNALAALAGEMDGFGLPPDAPPAFLLDETRRYGDGVVTPGRFDNRSVCFAADFPSATFLTSQGITSVLLIRQSDLQPQDDAAHALRRWQEAGLTTLSRPLNHPGTPAAIEVFKPSVFRSLWQRIGVGMRLKRNPLGGFGRGIPLYGAG